MEDGINTFAFIIYIYIYDVSSNYGINFIQDIFIYKIWTRTVTFYNIDANPNPSYYDL